MIAKGMVMVPVSGSPSVMMAVVTASPSGLVFRLAGVAAAFRTSPMVSLRSSAKVRVRVAGGT